MGEGHVGLVRLDADVIEHRRVRPACAGAAQPSLAMAPAQPLRARPPSRRRSFARALLVLFRERVEAVWVGRAPVRSFLNSVSSTFLARSIP